MEHQGKQGASLQNMTGYERFEVYAICIGAHPSDMDRLFIIHFLKLITSMQHRLIEATANKVQTIAQHIKDNGIDALTNDERLAITALATHVDHIRKYISGGVTETDNNGGC